MKVGSSHDARKELFRRGLAQGFITLADVDAALPPGTASQGERWLLIYSLRAAGVVIRDANGAAVEALPSPPAD
jgi:hypothetical protein